MNMINKVLLCAALTTTAPMLSAEQAVQVCTQEEQPTNTCQGNELLRLDDAYMATCCAAFKNGNEQSLMHNRVMQYYVRHISIDLLQDSTHQDAQAHIKELTQRLNTPFQDQITRQESQATQIENDLSGAELFALDKVITEACIHANAEKDMKVLFCYLALRCSLQTESIQLLLASNHPNAQTYATELLKRLAECTALHQHLAKTIVKNDTLESE